MELGGGEWTWVELGVGGWSWVEGWCKVIPKHDEFLFGEIQSECISQ